MCNRQHKFLRRDVESLDYRRLNAWVPNTLSLYLWFGARLATILAKDAQEGSLPPYFSLKKYLRQPGLTTICNLLRRKSSAHCHESCFADNIRNIPKQRLSGCVDGPKGLLVQMLPDFALPFFSEYCERTAKHLYRVMNVKDIFGALIRWPHRMNQELVCHVAGRISNADIRLL